MTVCHEPEAQLNIMMKEERLKSVDNLCYIGSTISKGLDLGIVDRGSLWLGNAETIKRVFYCCHLEVELTYHVTLKVHNKQMSSHGRGRIVFVWVELQRYFGCFGRG